MVWPFPPAPVTLSTNHCAQEIAEAMIKALAKSCPDRVLAGWSRRFRIAISGTNPRNKRKFIWHLFHARGRRRRFLGGRRLGDRRRGPGGGRHQVRQHRGGGDALPALLQAARVPARLRGRRPLPRRRGLGARAAHGDHRARPRQYRGRRGAVSGLRGAGREGRPAPPLPDDLARQDPRAEDEGGRASRFPPGAVFLVESMGGGGYGPPARRPAEARAADRVNGFVSAKPRRGKA